ncbi:MAG: hypothetical protein Q9214_000476 [Letrouitia sp. 1 TL-2023]
MENSVNDIWKSVHPNIRWQYRSKCQAVILQDFDFAQSHGVEDRLWESHVKINSQFRTQLKNFRDLKGKKKPVEQHPTALSTSDQLQAKPGAREALLQSCHNTLVRLGDLSRYRETELVKKGKLHNWGPAIGYYDLAITVWPESGLPYNQLAIIAQMDDDHFSALYYLYRAFCAQEPNPTARPNIEVEMKKIQASEEDWHKLNWSSLALTASNKAQTLGLAPKLRFLVLHARLYKGCSFSDHEKWENDMLSCIAIDFKTGAFGRDVVTKMVLINIAAEFAAGERIQGLPTETISKTNYQNLDDQTGTSAAEMNPIVQGILPALRHYSSWLLVRAKLLSAQLEEQFFKVEVQELWRAYASILTLLNNASHKDSTIMVHYLLEEDEEVAGSKLFNDDLVKHRFNFQGSSIRRPKWHNQGVERHDPNLEMLGRIHTFVQDGLTLAKDEDVPVTYLASTRSFSFDISIALERSSKTQCASPPKVASTTDGKTSRELPASNALSTSTHQVVDNQVGPGKDNCIEGKSTTVSPAQIPMVQAETQDGNKSSFHVGHSTLTALDFVHQMRGSPKLLLPNTYDSPFAPQNGEKASSTQPNTSKRPTQQSSQHRFPPEQQSSAIPTHSPDVGSSMPDPSSMEIPQPRNNCGILHQGQPRYFDSSFRSSKLSEGSYTERPSAYLATPPSGQG